MDLLDLLPILRRRWIVPVATVAAFVLVVMVFLAAAPTVYSTNAQLFVATAPATEGPQADDGGALAIGRTRSYTDLVDAPEVVFAVIEALDLDLTPEQVRSRVAASAPLGQVLIDVAVSDEDPDRAAAIANAVAVALADHLADVEVAVGALPPVQATLVRPASPPAAPVASPTMLLLGFAVMAGLLVGTASAVVADRTDGRLRRAADLAGGPVPLLGVVPLDPRAGARPVGTSSDPYGVRASAHRGLRATVAQWSDAGVPLVVAVVGTGAGVGATTTAVELAAGFAGDGRRVGLIEADLARPSLATVLGLDPDRGLSAVQRRSVSVGQAWQSAGARLAVLVAGGRPTTEEAIDVGQLEAVVARLAAAVDVVVLDVGAVSGAGPGARVAGLTGTTIVVAGAGATRRADLQRTVTALEECGASVSGVVLNRVDEAHPSFEPVAAGVGSRSVDVSAASDGRVP